MEYWATEYMKTADQISQMRRMVTRNPSILGSSVAGSSKDTIRAMVANKLIKPPFGPVETKVKPGTIFRGEGSPGLGSFAIGEQLKAPLQDSGKRYWSVTPENAIQYAAGPDPRLLVRRVDPNTLAYPHERAASGTLTSRAQELRMDARKDMASENKSRGLKYKIPRSYRKATSDLNFMSKVERGVPLKDVNAVRSSADGSTVQDFMPMELLQPKDVASEVAHKVDHGVGRSSWRTPSGTTVMTEGLRLSDMFKPGAKP